MKHDGVCPIEGLAWMSRTTLDIIGLAGKIHPIPRSVTSFLLSRKISRIRL